MSEVDFASLLDSKIEDSERPKPLPKGTYTVQVQRHEMGTSSRKGTPYVRIFFKILEAGDDVDKDKLSEPNIQRSLGNEKFDDFYLTEASTFMLRDFIEGALKLKVGSGRTFKDALAEIKGKRAQVIYKQEMTQNNNVRAIVDRWLPME